MSELDILEAVGIPVGGAILLQTHSIELLDQQPTT